ncbi:RagB/SusD family nutrient uptake outer membrane protein [Kriegella aquimaris]|uniref:Starch-binding associating with outer membrane n=1 Tax=Kriegella aquimaris TaxID=192904 RepID=A0A1G9XVW1_9FLAO|nr:RagB/SusD family nutrient uptake outer membrane protein [Kriegella aquimaris]SDN00566.1 Starch-binding associating with outer membrane [Kriegella aquimaris]
MKNIFYYIALLSILIIPTACEQYLEEEVFSTYGENNFPTGATVETMVNENHRLMGMLVVFNHRMGWATEMPTPSMQYNFRNIHERNNLSTWSWNNEYGDPAYYDIMERLWDVVRMSNDIIEKVPDIQMEDTQRQAEIVGEAKFLRGLAYFYGVRLWGGMPIVDKPQTLDDDLYPARASIEETYAFLTKDFEDAAAILPTKSEYTTRGFNAGHATKGAAQGMLAKAYITMAGEPLKDNSRLGEAKVLLESVISSGQYSLIQSATPYADLWDWNNDNNDEMMYVIQKEGIQQNFRGMFGYFTPNVFTRDIWTTGTDYSRGSALDGVPPEFAKWFQSHDSGPRFQWTIITEFELVDDKPPFLAGEIFTMEDGPQAQAYIGKYRAVGAELESNFSCPNNFPVLRYADVLLLHSEVSNELGTQDYSGLNTTRERAGLPPLAGLSQDDFRDSIFVERDLELTYEQQMLFDMRRRGLEYTKSKLEGFFNPNQNESSPGAGDGYPQDFQFTIEPHRMLFPYPPNEMLSNPNLVQNPGY